MCNQGYYESDADLTLCKIMEIEKIRTFSFAFWKYLVTESERTFEKCIIDIHSFMRLYCFMSFIFNRLCYFQSYPNYTKNFKNINIPVTLHTQHTQTHFRSQFWRKNLYFIAMIYHPIYFFYLVYMCGITIMKTYLITAPALLNQKKEIL